MSESFGPLEAALRERRDSGKKLLVPYVTGGFSSDWLDVVRALAACGADAIEVGIPFSDPMIDGPVIQAASQAALEAGTTPRSIVDALAGADVGVPLVVMTYANIVVRAGYRRMASELAAAGIGGAIVPDLPVDEAGEWMQQCASAGVDAVLLVAPTTPDDRLAMICSASRGFVYGVGLLGVTGEREVLAQSASEIARRTKAVSDRPVLVGIGISNPEQAVEVSRSADGVIVGSALVRRLLDGCGPSGAGEFVGAMRRALDG